MGHEGPKMTVERDPGQSRRIASVDQTEARNVVQELLDAASSGPLTRPARTPGPAAVSVERPRSPRPSSVRRDRHEARGPSMTLHKLGWRGDAPPTQADSVGRVAVEHRNGYVVYTEAG